MDEEKTRTKIMKQEGILEECYQVMTRCEKTIKWMHSFLKGHPSVIEIPEELKRQIDWTRLDLYDTKVMIEKMVKSVGKKDDNS